MATAVAPLPTIAAAAAATEPPQPKEEQPLVTGKANSFDDQMDIEPPTEKEGKPTSSNENEEGVEVVLGEQGPDQVVDKGSPSRPAPDQNVFRGSQPGATRHGRAGYPPRGPPPPPYGPVQGSGSFGYGRPEYAPRPYPVPPYNPSGSFDDASYHTSQRPPSHYSPHVQYPPPGERYPGEDVNVISPNHKSSDPNYRSGASGQRRPHPPHYYHYPPASPVSRGSGQTASPPRLRNFAVRRTVEGPYSKAQRSGEAHPEDGTWNPYPAPSRTASRADRPQPPLVTESSFDSDHFSNSHYSTHPSHPPTPGSGAPNHDPAQQFYGPAGSWASFDSAAGHPPPPHYDEYSLHPPHHPPHTPSSRYPEPPYSPYSPHTPHSHHSSGYHSHYSPGGGYYPPPDQYGSYHGYGAPPLSYEDDERGLLKDYHPDRDGKDEAADGKKGKAATNKTATGIVLPAAAHEIDFDVTDPPAEPVCPPSTEALVESLADVNTYDVLCGRGGGTNSQIGNKRFRKLVQEFQPTYLLARRKEKPLLARTIVLIIRKRGGRFLRKDEESGMLYEVGDAKAEAKTSQALREGLDVRATKSASTTLDKKKKKKGGAAGAVKTKEEETEEEPPKPPIEEKQEEKPLASPERTPERPSPSMEMAAPPEEQQPEPESPPSLPKLADEEVKSGMVHPHSPEAMQFRKRRRMRALACGADKFFPDFCPPRADLARSGSPIEEGMSRDDGSRAESILQHSPMRRASSIDEEDTPKPVAPGCTAAALEIVTGAVTGGFGCFGPSK